MTGVQTCALPIWILDQSLESIPSQFGAYIIRNKLSKDSSIYSQISGYLEQGLPVNVAINKPLLTYYLGERSKEFQIEFYNIGYHYVTVTAIDQNNYVTLFETNSRTPIRLSAQEFEDIWFFDSKYARKVVDKYQQCDGYYYCLYPPISTPQLCYYTKLLAVKRVVDSFFFSPIESVGSRGLDIFLEDTQSWREKKPEEGMLISSIRFFRVLELPLSGGGFGRKLFGFFLADLAESINDEVLRDLSKKFTRGASRWSKFICQINSTEVIKNNRINFDKLGDYIDEMVPELVDLEKECMDQLGNWVDTKLKHS